MKLTRYHYPICNTLDLIDRFFEPSFEAIDRRFGLAKELCCQEDSADLSAQAYEDDKHYYLRFELPGIKKEDVQVELEDRLLKIKAERKSDDEKGISKASAQGTLSIPENASAEKISAQLENGLLTLTLAKKAPQKAQSITVQ